MHDFRKGLAAAALSLAILPPAMGHGAPLPVLQTAQPVPVTTTELGDGIYMLQGRGGNVGVLAGEDGVFVIDAQYADMAPALLSAIDEIAGDAPRYILNTHWHGDHTGGNAAMAAAGAVIISHDEVRARVSIDQDIEFLGQPRNEPAAPPEAWPVITFSETMTLHLNGQTVRLIHTPSAHTDGDTFVHFVEADVIHTGDLLFAGRFPFIDLGSGGTLDGFRAGMSAVADLAGEGTQIIPGHGPLATRKDVIENIQMLDGTMAVVQAGIDDGKDLETLLDEAVLGQWTEDWAWAFITEPRFTSILYAGLTEE